MKKTHEIIGLPIISIADGDEVGKAKSVIINADKGTIDYIVVDSGSQILSARVVATEKLLGIGEHAITIENENVINDLGRMPVAIDLLQKDIQVRGSKVLTKKGRIIGEIGDLYIDCDTYNIVGLEYIADITQKRIRIIPRSSVITFGKNLVVVEENVETTLIDRIDELNPLGSDGLEKKNITFGDLDNVSAYDVSSDLEEPSYTESTPSTDESYDNQIKEAAEILASYGDTTEAETVSDWSAENQDIVLNVEAEPVAEEAQPESSGSGESLFEQRQRQYLRDRKVTKNILDRSGNVLVGEGTLITDDIIDMVKQNGKIVELVMNNKQ